MSCDNKKIIIVSPHFPPSNLAAVHRSRLFAQHLPALGWEPIIVTVDEAYYEEELDWNLAELLPQGLRIEKVKALPVKPLRLIGDIGIRGFWGMYQKILQLIKSEKIDFLYILIPSHFSALLGRLVHDKTGITYGIDYIDPWVHQWPGTEKRFSKHWWSMKLGTWLEPWAVKKTSVITGVAPGYYEAVLERNPHLRRQAVTAAMPYGGEKIDYDFIRNKDITPYLFKKEEGVIDMVYAGAMLPKAYEPLKQILLSIKENKLVFQNVRFHFIGTGKTPNDPEGYNIKPYAEKMGLWQTVVFEYPQRIPYLDVLTHLSAGDGAFILGSTEPHYTPSKVYQAVLSNKPVFSILHQKSSACKVIYDSNAGITLSFNGEEETFKIREQFLSYWELYMKFYKEFNSEQINTDKLAQFSAKNVTQTLASALDKIRY